MNLSQASKMNEEQARMYIESIVWKNGVVCPRCKNVGAWKIEGKSTRPGLYKCQACREPFTVTVGTIMESSHISLRQWVIAFHLMTSSKKGISALQIQRNLGLGSYRSAWHLAHRIRLAMTEDPLLNLLKGTVEVDETYVGGKPRKSNNGGGQTGAKRGRGTKKTPVLALVERSGKVRSMPIKRVDGNTLKGAIRQMCDRNSQIITDEWSAYQGIGKEFAGGHEVVRHNNHEYARGNVYTNTAESYFSLFKRGVMGAFHHISNYHLHRYCNEFSFRWGARKINDGERTALAIRGATGKRLVYKER